MPGELVAINAPNDRKICQAAKYAQHHSHPRKSLEHPPHITPARLSYIPFPQPRLGHQQQARADHGIHKNHPFGDQPFLSKLDLGPVEVADTDPPEKDQITHCPLPNAESGTKAIGRREFRHKRATIVSVSPV